MAAVFDPERGPNRILAPDAATRAMNALGPVIYNQAVTDVQERLQQRVSELDLEVHEDEFTYWRKYEGSGRGKK